jgi:hypothetical protein
MARIGESGTAIHCSNRATEVFTPVCGATPSPSVKFIIFAFSLPAYNEKADEYKLEAFLFVSQGDHRVHTGRAARGDVTRHQGDRREQDRYSSRGRQIVRAHFKEQAGDQAC